MNKILIPTDFSAHSNYALEYASYIAKEKGGELIILHITKDRDDVYLKNKTEEIKQYSYLKGIDFKIVIEEGHSVSKSINKVGVRHSIDLIIMGSNGISDVSEMLLGSNTENVIRNSQFNVLTIKSRMLDLNINSILFPSDFTEEAYAVFKTVKEFANLFSAKIVLLIVNTKDRSELKRSVEEKMDGLAEHFKLKSTDYEKVIVEDKNPELGIINCSIDKEVDMIAIGSHGKSVLQKLIKESTSHDLVRDSFRPVLTIRF